MRFFHTIIVVVFLLCNAVMLSASGDIKSFSMNEQDSYFKKASEKAKETEYGKGRVIAVLDTGINDDNIELHGQVIAEYDATTGKNVAIDNDGHGTKMASVIAAKKDGKGITGIAYNAKLIDVKVVDDKGNIKTEDIISGIEFAVKNGANVINMSFASGAYSKELESAIGKYAKKGIVFVAAAGNNGEKALAYPAGYNNVVAVSSLDRKSNKKAIYANYGEHINEYISDGIWTYDGKKYSREYGTSEACAAVSGYVEKDTYLTSHEEIKLIENIEYKLASPTVEDITFDAVLESDGGESYLNSLADYILIQKKTRYVFDKMNQMDLGSLDDIYSHSISGSAVSIYSDSILPKEVYARLFLFDLFGEYARLMIPGYNNEDLLGDSALNEIYGYITTSKNVLEGSSPIVEKLILFNAEIKKIIFKTKGKKDPISKMVRKYVRIYAGEINSKDISTFKTKALAGKLSRANEVLKGLGNLQKGLEYIIDKRSDLEALGKKQAYLKVFALDFILAMNSMIENNAYNSGTELSQTVNTTITYALLNSENMKSFVNTLSLAGYADFGLGEVVDLANKVVDSVLEENPILIDCTVETLPTCLKDANLKDAVVEVIKYLLRNDLEEGRSIYKYNMYKNYVLALNDDAFTIQDPKKLPFIKSGYILTNVMANIAVKEFTRHSFVYLKGLFSNTVNWNNNDTYIKTALENNFSLDRNGSYYEYHEISAKEYIYHHVVDSLAWLPKMVIADMHEKIGTSLDVMLGNNVVNPKKLDEYQYFKDIPGSKMDQLTKIFVTDYNDFLLTMTEFEIVLINMYSANYTYDLIANENTESKLKKEAVDQIETDVKSAAKVQVPKISQEFQDIVRDSMIFGEETGLSLLNKNIFLNMNEKVTRKDFMVMMMMAAIDEYNPFADADFLQRLASNNLSKQFPDMDANGFSSAEKIWILYAAQLGIINGDGNGNLNPMSLIPRKEAFSLYGGLIASSNKIKNKVVYTNQNSEEALSSIHNGVNANNTQYKAEIIDYDRNILDEFKELCPNITVENTLQEIIDYPNNSIQANNIRTAYLNGIFQGNLTYLGKSTNVFSTPPITTYIRKYELGLGKNLTVYEASVIAKNLYKNKYNIYNSMVPFILGDTTDNDDYSVCLSGGSVEGTQSLLTAYSGVEKVITFKTKILEEDEEKYKLFWSTSDGLLQSFQRNITDDGFVETSIIFIPSSVTETTIVPITISVRNFQGDSASKDIYVQVKPSTDYTEENIDPTQPNTTLSALYIDTENKFKVSWNSKNTDNLEVLYSYDQSNWSRFGLYNLNYYNGTNDTLSVNNSNLHNIIYFKAISSKGTEHVTSAILSHEYRVGTVNTGGKDTEIPVQAVMGSLSDYTRDTSVRVSWRTVQDSHGNDNAVSYEITYADNSSFSNETTINVGNNLFYVIDNLLDDEKYYFKVRAINHVGTGDWSVWESTRIDKEDLPFFSTTSQTPNNTSTGVSKTPTFRWDASDEDGDDLEYYVRIGESPDNLNFKSGWIEGTTRFDFAEAYDKPLKPNTTYYWQVTYREGHRLPEYYDGGVYPTSPVWSFTTVGTGPDLAVTNVAMIGELKIDEWVSFEVTVKNNGSEVSDDNDIKPYFVKNGIESEFAAYKYGVMQNQLNPGEEEKVIVKVQFSNKIEERTFTRFNLDGSEYQETKTYDNILVDGSNPVRFKLDYNEFDVDINSANDSNDLLVNYSFADNLPVIDYDSLTLNNLSNTKGDYRYMLGWTVTYQVNADDLVKIDKYEMEYRVSENDTWHHIQTYLNTDDSIAERIEWVIPNSQELVTQTMQLRVKVYNPSGMYSSVVSHQFKVFENSIDVDELYVDKSSYKLGEPIIITYNIATKYEIESFRLYLKQENDGSERLLDYTLESNDEFSTGDSLKFTVPNEANLLGDKAYIEAYPIDINGAYKKVESSRFTVVQNTDVPKVFSPYQDIFITQYSNFPSATTRQTTTNEITKIMLDDNGLAHVLISHHAEWWTVKSNGSLDQLQDHKIYYYLTYNIQTKYKSSPIKIFENRRIDSGNLAAEKYRDFIMNGNIPILITANSDARLIKKYQLNGTSLSSQTLLSDSYAQLVNYNNKTYIYYSTDESIQEDRRLKRMEIYPSVGSSENIIDEYLGTYIRIHDNLIYFYSKGKFYTLDDNLKVTGSIEDDIGSQSKYVRGDGVKIYDPTVKELLLDANQTLHIYNKDGTMESLLNIKPESFYYSDGLIASVYSDKVIICHHDDTIRKFKIIIYNRLTKISEITYIGNKTYNSGDVYDVVDLTNKQIIIGNPDGEYDAAGQIITADLTNGLSSVPSITVEADKIVNIGNDTTIRWAMSQESDKLINFKVYKVNQTSETLLDTISDTNIRSYNYTPTDVNEKFVNIKVVANYNDGESSSDTVSLQVLGNVTFNTFSTNETDFNLFESIEFVWDASGDNSNNLYTVYRQCEGENDWIELFETKENRQVYKIEDFSGICQFKIASGGNENILDYPVTINGDVFKFKEGSFSPIGDYTSSEGIVRFEWDIYFEGNPEYSLFIKKSGESEFNKIDSTISKYMDYNGDLGNSFDWKVSFVYDGKTIESQPMHVMLSKLGIPSITNQQFVVNAGTPSVSLTYSSVPGATSYEVYRSQYGNHFELITSVPNLNYVDTTVNYGGTYTYYVIAVQNEIKSLPSAEVSVDTTVDETYEVIMETANYQDLLGNEIVLNYKPNKEVSLELYEILTGTDINNLYTYDLTPNRETRISGLSYGETYYVEIYPLNQSGNRVSTLPAKITFITGYDSRIVTEKVNISIDEVAPDHVSLSWDEVVNADTYVICRSENSGSFECLESTETTSYTDSINLIKGYRYKYIVKAKNGNGFTLSDESIEVMPVPLDDTDGDGIPDHEDPNPNDGPLADNDNDGLLNQDDPDDDNDGMPDDYEAANGLNPLDASDANIDSDSDGYTNLQEYQAGTDPQDDSSNAFSLEIVGQTKHFLDATRVMGYRSYVDDGSYTGSLTLTDGSTLAVDGVYAITSNVLTIDRITPPSMNIVLTYLGEDAGVMTFNISIDGGAESQTYFYDTEQERDAAIPNEINPAVIMYLLN